MKASETGFQEIGINGPIVMSLAVISDGQLT